MKVLWICGLPDVVRLSGWCKVLSPTPTAAWSWIIGHLPPSDNVELHILCPVVGLEQQQIHFDYLGCHWHCFRRRPIRNVFSAISYFFRVRRFFNDLKPDVVHGWGGETGFGYAATILDKHAVVSVQGLLLLYCALSEDFNLKYRSLHGKLLLLREKQTYQKARVCLVESEASRRALERFYGQEGLYIPHPLRMEFLSADIANRDALIDKPIKFVFLGGIVKRKGAVDAIRALLPYLKTGTKLIFIGSGDQQPEIERLIRDGKLHETVVIYNELSPVQIVREFSDAQFFLLPSYGDTGPTALKEALACGLYPICYDNSGPKDLIGRYGCGELVETGDIGALTAAIGMCVREVGTCVARGLIAAQKVRSELSSEHVWNELLEVYDEVRK